MVDRYSKRNSNIETLRIVAMWLIVAHHYIVHNVDFAGMDNNFWDWLILDVYFRNIGRIAVGLFLIVSIWYLCAKNQSLFDSCRRIWLLERELLAYGIVIFILSVLVSQDNLTLQSIANAFLPLYTGNWWFASCYALLLLLIPFIFTGLQALSKKQHLQLVFISIILFGLIRFIPHSALSGSVGMSLFVDFVLISIVVTYMRWHVGSETIKEKKVFFLFFGIGAFASMPVLSYLSLLNIRFVSSLASSFMNAFYTSPGFVLSLAVEFAFFVVAVTAPKRNCFFVNFVAATTFGVYLISDQIFVRNYLWQRIFSYSEFELLNSPLLSAIGAISIVFIVCSILDQIRIILFRLTIDRHPGRLFERIYSKIIVRQSV